MLQSALISKLVVRGHRNAIGSSLASLADGRESYELLTAQTMSIVPLW